MVEERNRIDILEFLAFWTSPKALSAGRNQVSSIVSTELGDLTPLNRARSVAMLLNLTFRAVDHSTEAIEMSTPPFSPWPLVAVRYNNQRKSSNTAKSVHRQASLGRQ
jgi:hypothetical protein